MTESTVFGLAVLISLIGCGISAADQKEDNAVPLILLFLTFVLASAAAYRPPMAP